MRSDLEFNTKRFMYAYLTCNNLYYDSFKDEYVCASTGSHGKETLRRCIHCRNKLHGIVSENQLEGRVIDNV